MNLWIDAQLSPLLAGWIRENFDVQAQALRELGLRDAGDREIFHAAREAGAVVMTKDSDFLMLLDQLGPPPQILWITCGNTANEYLKRVLKVTLPTAIESLRREERLVEISR